MKLRLAASKLLARRIRVFEKDLVFQWILLHVQAGFDTPEFENANIKEWGVFYPFKTC